VLAFRLSASDGALGVGALVALDDWAGRVVGRNDSFRDLYVVAPEAAGNTWSGPFRATANDGSSYFVKSLQTCPAGQEGSLAVEQIVARVGDLIGAPVCKTSLIWIPSVLAGTQIRRGFPPLQDGIAHASWALEHCDEAGRPSLRDRAKDDNTRRHVGVYALYDWCFGSDPQWLYDQDSDRTIYSHDHGLYFPPHGMGGWTRQALIDQVGTANELRDSRTGLSAEAAKKTALALEAVTRDDLVQVLCSIPASWPVLDSDLEALGWFLETRVPAVASRVRNLV
jgi:hypothetical protein